MPTEARCRYCRQILPLNPDATLRRHADITRKVRRLDGAMRSPRCDGSGLPGLDPVTGMILMPTVTTVDGNHD